MHVFTSWMGNNSVWNCRTNLCIQLSTFHGLRSTEHFDWKCARVCCTSFANLQATLVPNLYANKTFFLFLIIAISCYTVKKTMCEHLMEKLKHFTITNYTRSNLWGKFKSLDDMWAWKKLINNPTCPIPV